MDRRLVSDVARIYGLFKEYACAVGAGDLERWIDLWVDEGVQIPQDSPFRMGKEVIRKAMEPAFTHIDKSSLVIQAEEIRIVGDLAYSYGYFALEVKDDTGGSYMTISGKFLDILEKQVDGSWKIAIDCQNFNSPSSRAMDGSRVS